MTPIIICIVLSGIITLFLIAPIRQSRPRTCYTLMLFIPVATLFGALAAFPPVSNTSLPRNTVVTIPEQAETYIKQGDFPLAIQMLTQHLKEKGRNKDVSLQLGRAYFAKGLLHAEHNENKAALENLSQAQKVSPKDAPYLNALQGFIVRIEDRATEN